MSNVYDPDVDLSICIPSYNRSGHLDRLLASIADHVPAISVADTDEVVGDATWVARCEVVVVLDGSTDDSMMIVQELAGGFPVLISVVGKPNGGLASARNRAVEEAKGHRVWLLDDDMLVTADAVAGHTDRSVDEGDVVCGPSHVVGNDRLTQFYERRWQQLSGCRRVLDADVVSFANASAPRHLFMEQRFDERFAGYGFEDYVLAIRLLEAGTQIWFAADAGVVYLVEKSRLARLHNMRDEGLNRRLIARLHPEAGSFAFQFTFGCNWNVVEVMARRGWSTPLWWTAQGLSVVMSVVRGRYRHRLAGLADRFALYSGLAKATRVR